MDKLTGADVRGFFVVAAALVVFLVGVLNLVKSWRDLRKPSANAEQWRADIIIIGVTTRVIFQRAFTHNLST